jgi:hypothetical protein
MVQFLMKSFSVGKFDDKKWLLVNYERLRHRRDVFGGGFFSLLLLAFFFFLVPFPHDIEDRIIWWKLCIFVLAVLVTISWYVSSMEYFHFSIKFLNYEFHQGRFPRQIKYEVTKFSPAQISFYIILGLLVPFLAMTFFHQSLDLTFFYWAFGVFSVCVILAFLVNIEHFYEKRERLEEIEILTDAMIYRDPLHVLDEHSQLKTPQAFEEENQAIENTEEPEKISFKKTSNSSLKKEE